MDILRKFWPLYLLTGVIFVFIAAGSSRVVTVMAENAPIARGTVIIVDAGHGGVDGGAVSCTGVYESHINLEIALRLRDTLQLLGIPTHMIRTQDVSVYTQGNTIAAKKVSDLKNRVNTVNSMADVILVSIHQNTYPQEKYSGAQVFYNCQEAKPMAQALQKAFADAIDPNNRRPTRQSKGVYLMEKVTRPALLVECGFLSNRAEEEKLRQPAYQQKIAQVIAATLSQILSNS